MDRSAISHKKYEFGKPPFRFVGMWSAPSKGLLETNPEAYSNAMMGKPEYCRFTCEHCGMSIEHHCVIRDSEGKYFSVGSTCIGKVDDIENLTEAEKMAKDAAKSRRKAKADEKREQIRAAREAALEAEKERNGGLTDWELAEKQRKDILKSFRSQYSEAAAAFINALEDGGEFCQSIIRSLRRGELPEGRGKDLVIEIRTKKESGRKGSKAYLSHLPIVESEYSELVGRFEAIRSECAEELNKI